MKVAVVFDLQSWMKPQDIWFQNAHTVNDKVEGGSAIRYLVEVEVPDHPAVKPDVVIQAEGTPI